MRGIVIDPEKRTITEVDVDGSLQSIHDAIGVEGGMDSTCIASHDIGAREVRDYAWLDDEGIARGEPIHAFKLRIRDDIFGGKCLILGADAEGNECDAKFAIPVLTGEIVWLGLIKPELTWVTEGNHIRSVVTYERVVP